MRRVLRPKLSHCAFIAFDGASDGYRIRFHELIALVTERARKVAENSREP
jgi:hypothetical protein